MFKMRKTNFPKLFFNSGYYSLSAAAMDTQKMMWLVLLVVNLLVSAADGSSSTLETRSHSNFIPTENSNLEVLKELGVDIQSEVPENSVSTVQGSSVELPCNVTAPAEGDSVRLVLWFKNESSLPIYTYDTRGKSFEEARHWSDDQALQGRAFFRGDHEPGRLVLDNVKGEDQGVYKCRVDFKKAPTRISNLYLNVIVPPEKPRIYTADDNNEVRLKLGPYKVGDTIRLRCVALGGRPLPRVTWWRDHALLDDSFKRFGDFKVENELIIYELKREDLHSILTCQASNNNISVPVSTSVKLDMNFGPTKVNILNGREPISAGKRYEVNCQTVGARPQPTVTWWMAGKQLQNMVTERVSPDGNVTVSTLMFIPSVLDAGNLLVCRAGNPGIPDSMMEDAWKLEIHYVPSSTLTLGSNLNASNIKEGDDVYFECSVKASPRPYKITWRHNGRELIHNVQKKVIISNQSLVLQKVTRSDSGVYTCTAHNAEGDGMSNSINLDVRYKPFCKPGQVKVYGVAKRERIHVSCDVIANPSSQNLKFEWVFNSSSERLDVQENLIKTSGTRSVAEHMPQTEMDYGSLMCWATNAIGRMSDPCIFHLIPAGRPDPVHNCTVQNQTLSTIHVVCAPGFDGGLPQIFTMEVMDEATNFVVANTTNSQASRFTVTGLRPGTGYLVSISSANAKGRSDVTKISAFTIKQPERMTESGESALTKVGEFTVTPILAILMVVGGALFLVFLIISAVFCFRKKRRPPHKSSSMTRMTHIALQKGIDDCIDCPGPMGTPSITTGLMENDKNPDIIPVQKRESMEEEGGFGVYGEKTRYATLQKQKHDNPGTNNRGYETLRHFRSNIPSLSQEVTYAELTLPRNKGYSQMRPAQSGVVVTGVAGEPVVYARIDHARRTHPHHVHHGGPLLTSCSSSGGGISPNSLMNTSVDSSAGSSSSSSCTRIMANPTNIIRNDLGERSSADEGFTSGGSPVGDCGSSSGGSGTGRSGVGRIPILLSPDSAGDSSAQLVSTHHKKAALVFHSCSSPTSGNALQSRCSAEDQKSVGPKTPLLAESLARESTV